MTNYPYINNLFTTVLSYSNAIKGRFHIGHNYGLQDINFDYIVDSLKGIPKEKYPLVMMAPPHSYLDFSDQKEGWEEFRMIMFFMKTSFYDSTGKVIDPSKSKLSQHTIPEDWHDMKRCAVAFIRVLKDLQHKAHPPKYIIPNHKVLFIPLQNIGTDRLAGVRIDFDFKLNVGCGLEDYKDYPDLSCIKIPDDGHPEHKL